MPDSATDPRAVRDQHARARDARRQPGRGRGPERPRRRQRDGRAVRARGAVRRGIPDPALRTPALTVTPASLEQNVTAVLTKVAAGEADAGLVYATDVLGRTDVESLVPEGAADVVNRYPIAALADSANPEAAAGVRRVRPERAGPGGARASRVRRAVRARAGFIPQILLVPAVLGLALLVLPARRARRHASTGRPSGPTSPRPRRSRRSRLSLGTGLVATGVCVLLGVPLALVIARSGPRTAGVLRALVTVPLVLPPMVGGIALLFLFGRTGWFGGAARRVGHPAAVHDARGRPRADLRRAAVPRPRARGVAAHHRRRLRADRRRARRRPLDDPAARHPAARRARTDRRRHPVLRPRDRRVRRDRALRRQRARASRRPCRSRSTPRSTAQASRRAPRSRCRCCCSSPPIAVLLLVRAWRPEAPR